MEPKGVVQRVLDRGRQTAYHPADPLNGDRSHLLGLGFGINTQAGSCCRHQHLEGMDSPHCRSCYPGGFRGIPTGAHGARTLRPMAALVNLDELMANAWPPLVVERRSGWRFRWTKGLSRRANSVLAVGADERTPQLVAEAEHFYAAHNASPRFQVSTASAPKTLASYLDGRGYERSGLTYVEQAPTADVFSRTRSTQADAFQFVVTDRPTDEWFTTYWSVESTHDRTDADIGTYRDILLAPALPQVFITGNRFGETVGVGQAVIEQAHAGVQCMATRAGHRRTGISSAVLHALAYEALRMNAHTMYLAVMATNTPALALYDRAGFRHAHEYSYFAQATTR